ncbi:MAG: hypothetical protein HQ465_20800 [Rhodospirillales bacterium]|nr:hypothetical protein [Rhodospirillales bacterium]
MTGSGSAVFVGAARDCARWLPRVLDNLARLTRFYDRTAFVFAVSDTTDATSCVLREWLDDGRQGKVLDLGHLLERLPLRTERIAEARNACLDEIRGSPWAEYDHLVVADLDDVLAEPLDVESYRRAIAWLEGAPIRAAVFANATPRYYDIWALRHDSWCPDDCWHRIWGRPDSQSFEAAKFREVFARQIELPRHIAPIEVRSAFGGLGLYRMAFARDAEYGGTDGQGREVSEHVAFNESIGRAGGRLHIFPELQVQAPKQHLYEASEFGLRWRTTMRLREAMEYCRPAWRRLVARA